MRIFLFCVHLLFYESLYSGLCTGTNLINPIHFYSGVLGIMVRGNKITPFLSLTF